ncbi:MAG: D-alanine--D-alanine ligase [Taibaiella sp.]|nr:D-alanine--D-alanine ligase [Taibaiella sp.]
MTPKKLAIVAGGYSGEYVISLRSVKTVMDHLDRSLYDIYKIIITKDRWYAELEDGSETDVDKNDFSIESGGQKINFDGVFIVIHGTPGEDGRLQGYFDMIGLPYTTCNAIVSALTFNKSSCNQVVKNMQVVQVANSIRLFKKGGYSIGAILEEVNLPLFVKPNESGSSLGVSKVTEVSQLQAAIDAAFEEDNEVLVEEFIKGRELTIGVFEQDGKIVVLPPTEIISKNVFFDFEAKYTTGVTDEITPAQIPDDLRKEMEEKSEIIYKGLGCRGVVRIDYIWNSEDQHLYFLEVNTMPGQSENSLIPQQVIAHGMSLKEFYEGIIKETLGF